MKQRTKPRTVYVCPECHSVSLRPRRHHNRAMVKCDAGQPGDDRSKPVLDIHGHIVTRAPRWWVETCIETARANAPAGPNPSRSDKDQL